MTRAQVQPEAPVAGSDWAGGRCRDPASTSPPRRVDLDSLVEIYHRFTPGLYRYAARQLGDQALAEDCVAETFRRLLEALAGGGGPYEYVQAYLYTIAHNWITDQFRKKSLPVEPAIPRAGSTRHDPARIAQERLELDRVRAALTHLNPSQRQVIAMRYLEGRSHHEIAALLGKSIGSVRTLQHRGVVQLKRLLVQSESWG